MLYLCAALFLLSGCLEDRKALRSASAENPSSWFEGVESVQNLGGYPISIKINWIATPQAQAYRIYAVTRDPQTNMIGWNLIATVTDPNISSYIHRDVNVLLPGLTFTYRVKAVDGYGVEDANIRQKSTVAFEGISRVEVINQTSAQIFINTSGSFTGFQVTAHPTRLSETNRSQDVNKIFTSNQGNFVIPELTPGTTYSFRVQVLVNNEGALDGNNLTVIKQTPSLSFGTGARTDSLSSFEFRNVRLVQAFGDAPNEANTITLPGAPTDLTPDANPHERVIRVTPNPFATLKGRFRVIRTAAVGLTRTSAPEAFPTTITDVCTDTMDTSCVVCGHAGVGSPNVENGQCDLTMENIPPTFTDTRIAAPPKKYFYTITYVHQRNGATWPEELPLENKNDFLFAAHVPDPYMVLVHRESANYEMCQLLGKAPNPRRFNRCEYSGIAAVPRRTDGTGLDLDDGFFDFGYNLAADRHALACNWSRPATPAPCDNPRGCVNFAVPPRGAADTSYFSVETSRTVQPLPALPASLQNITPNQAYQQNPSALFNVQREGNNCYVAYLSALSGLTSDPAANPTVLAGKFWPIGQLAQESLSIDSSVAPQTKAQIDSIIRTIATPDPGPLSPSGYTDRKRPAITGLSNSEAQALCNTQRSSYGTKRLMRRREYIAATPLPSFAGEPGFTTITNRNALLAGTAGQTLYDWSSATPQYGDGTEAGRGLNPGSCSTRGSTARVEANPSYCELVAGCGTVPKNVTLPKTSASFCDNPLGCDQPLYRYGGFHVQARANDGTNLYTDERTAYYNDYLNEKNEVAQVSTTSTQGGNSYSQQFFIGSLATNKCKSRFGMQDPYASLSRTVGSGFHTDLDTAMGFVFSDQFIQRSTASLSSNPPIFIPTSNPLDFGVSYDYRYNLGANSIQFSTDTQGYSFAGKTGSRSLTCTDPVNDITHHWFADNFYYLLNVDRAEQTVTCAAASSSLNFIDSRSETSFPGYLPILGIPLSNATNLNPLQDQVSFSSFLYGSNFAATPTSRQTYARFYASDNSGNRVVNMSSGFGSRWSFEISQSSEFNNAGSVWCARELE